MTQVSKRGSKKELRDLIACGSETFENPGLELGFSKVSEPPKQHENDNDDQDGADDTDAPVAEAVTVTAELAAEAAEQKDDEEDNEDGSERHDCLLLSFSILEA
jgi:hypothetical protein